MADYSKLLLSIVDVFPERPYYDYGLTHEQNQNITYSEGSFGIGFGMPESAFQVPFFVLPFLMVR